MANCKLAYKLIEYKDVEVYFNSEKINQWCNDDDHTYFLIADASVSELMIERNPGLKYLPFFPVKINEKSTKKSDFMKS